MPFRESRPYAGEMELALLLPLSDDNTVRASFMEFYEGALIAADELRNAGHSVVLNLFNTERSPETVRTITAAEAFRHSDVIIGPVYEDELAPVAEYSRLTRRTGGLAARRPRGGIWRYGVQHVTGAFPPL